MAMNDDATSETQLLTRQSETDLAHKKDLAVARDMVEHYITIDRRRNVKALWWICTIFLLVVVAVSAIVISVGLMLVNESRLSAESAEEASEKIKGFDAAVAGVVTQVGEMNSRTAELSRTVDADRAAREDERVILREDLKRFSVWHDGKLSGVRDAVATVADLRKRLTEMEQSDAARNSKLNEIEQRYAELITGRTKIENGPPPKMNDMAVDVAAAPANLPPIPVPAVPGGAGEGVTYPDGTRYEGEMRDGKKHGQGTFTFVNGDRYTGEFVDDLREGQGTYYYSTGDSYVGPFVKGRRHGAGTYYYVNGDVFQGPYADGKMNGRGIYTCADGQRIDGVWQDDVLVQ